MSATFLTNIYPQLFIFQDVANFFVKHPKPIQGRRNRFVYPQNHVGIGCHGATCHAFSAFDVRGGGGVTGMIFVLSIDVVYAQTK